MTGSRITSKVSFSVAYQSAKIVLRSWFSCSAGAVRCPPPKLPRPPLPTRKVVPARNSTLVTTLNVADPSRGGDFELAMDSVPGDPGARPLDVEYRLPLRQSRASRPRSRERSSAT